MRLAIVSHKVCWPSHGSPTGFASDGGFPMQMQAIAELFDETHLLVPVDHRLSSPGEIPIHGRALSVVPLTMPKGHALTRKLFLVVWLLRNCGTLVRQAWAADAIHAPIPGDVGTIGIALALTFGKPLFIRHCGNWTVPRTRAEHFWRWLLEKVASTRCVVLTTGGSAAPPSKRNPSIRWIFATSLTEQELRSYARPRAACPGGAPRLVIACRQDREKGTGVVIAALPLVARSYPGVRLDVLGDGSHLDEFRRQAAALGVSDRVVFHGKVDHGRVIESLQQADVFCFPTSASEGFPKAVLEAMACGLPVVCTRVSVLGHLVGGGAGILIDAASPASLADAVLAVLDDEARYRALSATGIEVAGKYSLERWASEIRVRLTAGWGALSAHG